MQSNYFTKGDRSSGPLFQKGVRTPAAHLFSKFAPPAQHQASHAAAAAAAHAEERAMAFLQRPKPR